MIPRNQDDFIAMYSRETLELMSRSPLRFEGRRQRFKHDRNKAMSHRLVTVNGQVRIFQVQSGRFDQKLNCCGGRFRSMVQGRHEDLFVLR